MSGRGGKPREARVRVELTVDNRKDMSTEGDLPDIKSDRLVRFRADLGEGGRESNTTLSVGTTSFWEEMVPWVGQT